MTDNNSSGVQFQSTVRARPLNCDQVAWMLSAIDRYLPATNHPCVSRAREMQKYALLYELMEVAHLYFEDASAQHNGTPNDVRRFQYASKQHEVMAQGQGGLLAKRLDTPNDQPSANACWQRKD